MRAGAAERGRLLAGLLIALLVGAVVLSARTGALEISTADVVRLLARPLGLFGSPPVDPHHEAVFWTIRLPRIVLGALIGAALGVSGAAMQGVFRNPLAEPSLLGVSGGAVPSASSCS